MPGTFSVDCAHVRNRGVRRAQVGRDRRRRGAAPAGVPRLRLGRGRAGRTTARIVGDKRAGKLANLDKALAETPLPEATTGIGHTRWATHGAPTDAQRPPAPRRGEAGWRSCTTGSSRTSRRCAPSSRRPGTSCAPRPTPRSPPTCWSEPSPTGADLTTAMQQRVRPAGGRVHAGRRRRRRTRTGSSPPAATRRSSSGVGEGENFVASDVAAFIEHTRDALELGQDQVVTITRDGVDGHRLRRQRRPRRRPYHVDWDLTAAEKDGFDWFMRKEIFEQPRAVARLAARPPRRRRASCSSTRSGSARTSCATSTRSSSPPAAPRSTPGWSRSTPSSTGPGSPARSSSPTSSATATRSSPATPWSSRSASPARPPTP